MQVWFSIEVFDGEFSASAWADAHGDALVTSALDEGAVDWEWHRTTWGVILELAFSEEAAWERFAARARVQSALDAVPDPVSGLLVYQGRGGSAGKRHPRRPKPFAGAGANALPLPEEELAFDALLFPEHPAALALN